MLFWGLDSVDLYIQFFGTKLSATEVFFSTYWRFTSQIIIIIIIIIIIKCGPKQ